MSSTQACGCFGALPFMAICCLAPNFYVSILLGLFLEYLVAECWFGPAATRAGRGRRAVPAAPRAAPPRSDPRPSGPFADEPRARVARSTRGGRLGSTLAREPRRRARPPA